MNTLKLMATDAVDHLVCPEEFNDLTRRLHVPISIIKPLTFAEVFKVLKH